MPEWAPEAPETRRWDGGPLERPKMRARGPPERQKNPTEAPVQLESRSAFDWRGVGVRDLAPGAPRDGLARAFLEEKQHHKTFAEDLTRLRAEGLANCCFCVL